MPDSIAARRLRARRRQTLVSVPVQRHRDDSDARGFRAKAQPGSDEFKTNVAEPVMQAVDKMPAIWRQLVHEYGYVHVYRAMLFKMDPQHVRAMAEENGGVFEL